jgi:SET domain-containing protein
MLLVPVRIDLSTIHGLGVFALDRIAEGTPIWRFTPGFDLDLDPRLLDEQPAHFRQTMLHYGYIDSSLNRFILCCDDCRFMNHSDSPNIRIERHVDRYGVDVAARDIEAGEELTVDYDSVEGSRPAPTEQSQNN